MVILGQGSNVPSLMDPTEQHFEVVIHSPSDDTLEMTNFTSLKQMPIAELVAELSEGLCMVNDEKQAPKEGESSYLF